MPSVPLSCGILGRNGGPVVGVKGHKGQQLFLTVQKDFTIFTAGVVAAARVC